MHPRPLLLLLLCAVAAGCSTPVRPTAPVDAQPHFGDTWFEHRAQSLGITPDAAKARDAAIPVDAPPAGPWDPTVAQEAAAIWTSTCARCHGVNGDLEGAPPMTPPPRKFGGMGLRMGFTFGGDKMRAGIYRKIMEGGAVVDGKPSAMPAWGRQLSREQGWALARYVESL